MAETLSDLIVALRADVADLKSGMKEGEKAVTDMSTASYMSLEKLSGQMVSIGQRALSLGKDMAAGAIEDEQFNKQLRVTIGDAKKTEDALKQLDDLLKGGIGFDEDTLKSSIQTLGRFRTDIDETLTSAMNLAAGTGRSLEDASQIIGLFATGNARAMTQLQRGFGITKDEIMKFSKSGKADMEALLAYIEHRFPNAAKEMATTGAGQIQAVKNQFNMLKDSIGTGFMQAVTPLLKHMGTLLQLLNDMPDSTKAAIGGIVAFGGVSLTVGGFILQLTTNLLNVKKALNDYIISTNAAKTATDGLTASSKGFITATAGTAGMVAAIGLIAVSAGLAIAKIQSMRDETKRLKIDMDNAAKTEATMATYAKETIDTHDLSNKPLAERVKVFKEGGYSKEDLIKAQAGLQAEYSATQDPEEKKRIDNIRQSIRQIAIEMANEMKPAFQDGMIEPLTKAEQLTKDIEHNLKMGTQNKLGAASQYGSVADYYRQAMDAESDPEKKQALKDKLYSAEERRQELGGKEIDLSGYQGYMPGLPGGKSATTDVEAFKKRMGIGVEETAEAGGKIEVKADNVVVAPTGGTGSISATIPSSITRDYDIAAAAKQRVSAPSTYGTDRYGGPGFNLFSGFTGAEDFAASAPQGSRSAGDVWRQMLTPDAKESYGPGLSADAITNAEWRDQLNAKKNTLAGTSAGLTPQEISAKSDATASKFIVEVLVQGQKQSEYSNGEITVKTRTTTDQPSYKEVTQGE